MLNSWTKASMDRMFLVCFTTTIEAKTILWNTKRKIVIKFNLRWSLFAVRWIILSIGMSFHSHPSYRRRFQLYSLYFNLYFSHLSSEFVGWTQHTRSFRNRIIIMNELARISRKMRRVSKLKYPPASSQFPHSTLYYTVTNFWWACFEPNRTPESFEVVVFFFIHFLTFTILVWFLFELFSGSFAILNKNFNIFASKHERSHEPWAKFQISIFLLLYRFSFLSITCLIYTCYFFFS